MSQFQLLIIISVTLLKINAFAYTDRFDSNARRYADFSEYGVRQNIQSVLNGTMPFSDIKNVTITVVDGVVYLSGTVANENIHQKLKGIILKIPGVTSIEDHIIVHR